MKRKIFETYVRVKILMNIGCGQVSHARWIIALILLVGIYIKNTLIMILIGICSIAALILLGKIYKKLGLIELENEIISRELNPVLRNIERNTNTHSMTRLSRKKGLGGHKPPKPPSLSQ